MIHCHCSRCREGTGTSHATNLYVEPTPSAALVGRACPIKALADN
jgi:hypothetical protein